VETREQSRKTGTRPKFQGQGNNAALGFHLNYITNGCSPKATEMERRRIASVFGNEKWLEPGRRKIMNNKQGGHEDG
jgi:hypothetical protein